MQAGANIAIKAQAVNDQYDAIKTKAYADFGREIKLKQMRYRQAHSTPQYPRPGWREL
jgi:hypothetical protein